MYTSQSPSLSAAAAEEYAAWYSQHVDNHRNHLQLHPSTSRAIIHFCIKITQGQEALLADTLDSLAAQEFSEWRLTVFADYPAPEMLWEELDALHWQQVPSSELSYSFLKQYITAIAADWVVVLQPGVVLSPFACAYVLDYAQRFPAWQFIYTDEDHIDAAGQYVKPHFKPDFNLDLLRSMPYVGHFCLVRHSAFASLSAITLAPDAEVYALALACVDYFGDAAIGHVPEVLAHVPVLVGQGFNVAGGQEVLLEHLARQGLVAAVSPGFLPQTYFVDYVLQEQAAVSIIIRVGSDITVLRDCLLSILEKTHYANYDIILLDELGLVSAEFLNDFNSAVRISLKQLKFSGIAHTINVGAAQSLAAYVLLLAVDTLVLQGDWLTRLVALGQRAEVGVVGARLLNAQQQLMHAGTILGLGDLGVADYWQRGIAFTAPGYMQRAGVTQNFSAVSSACMLVKQRLWQELQGFIEDYSESLFSEVDFCLRVRQLGYWIVWTPYVSLLYSGSLMLKTPETDNARIAQRAEADRFIKCWLPQLAHDPAFNRHLSLKHALPKIEKLTAVRWDAGKSGVPKIWAFPVNDMGVGEYRVRSPLKALHNYGLAQVSLLPNHQERVLPDIVEIERGQPDVLLLQNGHVRFLENAWESYAAFNQVFKIYAQDDLVYHLPRKHPLKAIWPKDLHRRIRQLLQHSDRLIVANEVLAAEFGKMITDVRIVPNYLEVGRWTNLAMPRAPRLDGLPRVGWAGAGQHQGDLELMLPILQATYKHVNWIFLGMCPEILRPYVHEFHGGVPFDAYPAKLASLDLDLAVAPLEMNKFNQAKTNLRLLEYGVMAWPVVCTDIQPYKNAPVTRLANSAKLWIATILDKLSDPKALSREGEVLQQWVLENYMLENHLAEWVAALSPER